MHISTFGSAVSSDPGDSGALMAVIQTVTNCLLQSSRMVVVAVKNRTSLIVNPVSSMTSRWAQVSKLSPCSRCPPGWAMRPRRRSVGFLDSIHNLARNAPDPWLPFLLPIRMWLSVSLLKTKTATPTLGRDMMTPVLSEFRRRMFSQLCTKLFLKTPTYIYGFSQCPTALVLLHSACGPFARHYRSSFFPGLARRACIHPV